MAYALGLDHRMLLPPFFPVQRDEDAVFGALLRACGNGALFGHVPIQLVHEPPETRTYAAEVWRAPQVEISTIILQVIGSIDFGPVRDGARRLTMTGRRLIDAASVDPREFLRFTRERVWAGVQREVSLLQTLLKTHGRRPEYWARDCDRHIADLLVAAVDPAYAIPADLRRTRNADEALALTMRLVHSFGELLLAWADLVQAARTLRQQGLTLARPIPNRTIPPSGSRATHK